MTKKEIARKVWLAFAWGYLFYTTIKFLIGKADTFSTICMFACYSVMTLILALGLIIKIAEKIIDYKLYKFLVNEFEYLQAVHKERYKLYFSRNRENVEEYTAEIERCGNVILKTCKSILSNNLLSEKYVESIEEMLKQTEKLMTTTN